MSNRGLIVSSNIENKIDLVRYGAVAMEEYGNRKIPVLGVDTSNREDLKEMLLIHQHMPPGDCFTQWAVSKKNKNFILLFFKFERPSKISFYIPLYFHEHSWVIEGILQAKVVFLTSVTKGDLTTEMFTGLEESISIEIGADIDISENWKKWQEKAIKKHLKAKGLSKKDVANITNELMRSGKEFWAEYVEFKE